MLKIVSFRYSTHALICANIALQVTAFCLMKIAWIHAGHSTMNMFNYITVLVIGSLFLRVFVWQHLLKINDLVSSYLPNAIVPSLLVFAGYFIFHEQITAFNIIGSFIIMNGLFLLIWSAKK